MLQHLSIRNYAIIREVDFDLKNGFNIITGETGAGKSIVVGALGLVLGDRADSSVLADKSTKCLVEAHFRPSVHDETRSLLQLWEIETDDVVILRREIGNNGKSRAFVNDTPVNLAQLRQISDLLVDMHQQFDSMELGENRTQFHVLDALAGNAKKLQDYDSHFKAWQEASQALDGLRRLQENDLRESDYIRFLTEELNDLGLQEGELEALESQLGLLEHAEEVRRSISGMVMGFKEGDRPILPQIKSMINGLMTISKYHVSIPALLERTQSSFLELQDIVNEIDHIQNSINTDEAKVILLRERLDQGNRLLRKHGVRSTGELLGIQRSLGEKILSFQNRSEDVKAMEKTVELHRVKSIELASELTVRRQAEIGALEEKVATLLKQVGMPSARLKVELSASTLNAWGSDRVEFLFDANRNDRFEPIQRIASGGELSRLMLVLKSILAGKQEMPTLIFDEIDSGISGEAARQVGLLMKELSSRHQVISITHQPQIAARADSHYLIYKKENSFGIETQIRKLDEEERVDVIARMMGGEKPTAIVLENAREMVRG